MRGGGVGVAVLGLRRGGVAGDGRGGVGGRVELEVLWVVGGLGLRVELRHWGGRGREEEARVGNGMGGEGKVVSLGGEGGKGWSRVGMLVRMEVLGVWRMERCCLGEFLC